MAARNAQAGFENSLHRAAARSASRQADLALNPDRLLYLSKFPFLSGSTEKGDTFASWLSRFRWERLLRLRKDDGPVGRTDSDVRNKGLRRRVPQFPHHARGSFDAHQPACLQSDKTQFVRTTR